MTTSQQERDTLREALSQVLGPGPAVTLWNMLPPDQHQLATKADIHELEILMERFDQRLWDFHEALRAQTRIYLTATVSSMIGVGALAVAGAAAF